MNEKTTPAAKPLASKTSPEAVIGTASTLDTSARAEIAAATEFSPSGAPRQVTDIEVDHPAVDNDPRSGTTVDQNRIDFNNPSIEGREAVERALTSQSDQ